MGARMKAGLVSRVVCLACCLAGFAASPLAALGEGTSERPAGGEATASPPLLSNPLVTVGSPAQAEETLAAEAATLANPARVAERRASRTRFKRMDTTAAAHLAADAFPALVKDTAGGPPQLRQGESVVGFFSDNAEQVKLPGGRHGVIESSVPIAFETATGKHTAINLGLTDTVTGFEPNTPLVRVHIPKDLAGGVSLPGAGVSLTPVDAHGTSLHGSQGSHDGASVFYANTQTDADTLIKPTTLGFEEDTFLRSAGSPRRLSFRIGMPAGARLARASHGARSVQVISRAGAVIASILVPSASDASDTTVPVSMTVAGATLTLTIAAGEYQYPIAVDPAVTDEQLTGATKPTHWKFGPSGATHFTSSGWKGTEGLTLQSTGTYAEREKGYLYYETQGESKIEKAWVESSGKNAGNIETVLQMAHLNGSEEVNEDSVLLAAAGHEYGKTAWQVCDDFYVYGECNLTEESHYGAPHNLVKLQQSATAGGAGENVAKLYTAQVAISQANGPETPTFNTTSPTLYNGHENVPNVLYLKEGKAENWLSPHTGAFEVKSKDPGLGISDFKMGAGGWGFNEELYEKGLCEGVQCPPEFNDTFTYNSKLIDGLDTAEVRTEDAGLAFSPGAFATFKVDSTPPAVVLTGLPASGIINEAQYHLFAQATDGKAKVPSSGVKSVTLALDGFVLAGTTGGCTPGPCTATGEWTINGEEFGAGKHTLTVQVLDNAGNEERQNYNVTVRHANSLPVGPGSVDPITGALHLGANDVTVGGGTGPLGISRSYNSRQLTAGAEGPLGPQWTLNISGSQTLEEEPATNRVVLIGADGGRTTFESDGKGGFISPPGDENLVLETEKEGETIKAYVLKNPVAGTTVKFIRLGSGGPWVVSSTEGTESQTNGGKEAIEWEQIESITRPRLALAPAAAGIKCSGTVKEAKELAIGCRALSFTYATETTASGEAPSEWKAYKGRLMTVSFTAYNASTKAMETKPVAEYAYDKKGRLRAEWDPRIEPALKTTYGYDAENHVTSVNPAGQEPWLLHYGTTAADTSAGRLLAVTRVGAGTSTQVKEQDEKAAPSNTAVPTLSTTTPAVGTTVSVASNGTWSNSPLAYSYAWEDCYTPEGFGERCTAIAGAVNATYTPQARDAGYKLKAQVTAVNAGGSAVATTATSSALALTAPAYLRKFGEKGAGEKGQVNAPTADAVDSSGNVWVADHNNNRIEEWSATGTWLHTYGTKGTGTLQFEGPEGIAVNTTSSSASFGDVYVADKGNNRVEELKSNGEYIRSFGEKGTETGQMTAPLGVALAPNGNVWVTDSSNNRVDEFSENGAYIGSFGSEGTGPGQFKTPNGIAFSGENAYVADAGNNRVEEFSMSGQYVAKFGSKGTGNGQFETPASIATEPVSGDLLVADSLNHRIQLFNPGGVFLAAVGKKGEGTGEFSGPLGVAANSAGDIYVVDTGNNRMQEFEPKYSTNNPLPEPPALGTSYVTTIAYNVPLSGAGAPHEMTKAELEKWGQADLPSEPAPGQSLATAVFPPDEPMGWPAKDYKRATISYLDELGRTVNRALPSGGIATSEYNEANEIIRSLSPANRATALKESCESKEKCKSAELAGFLDTKSKYNGETKLEREAEEEHGGHVEAGARLLETRGPRHTIRLATGSEVLARNRVAYSYDEGAPEGGTYDLVTRTQDSAEYESGQHEVRITESSYSGQSNLGWKIRKPTSVTIGSTGSSGPNNLSRNTVYDSGTGKVVETRTPLSEVVGNYLGQFGSAGSGEGQFGSGIGPSDVAVDKAGDLWVTDPTNNRIEEFSSSGTFLKAFGTEGTGNGQFKHPEGISVTPWEGNILVADTGNNRVQLFSSTGTFIRKWGTEGSGNSQFHSPKAVIQSPAGWVYVLDTGNNRIQQFNIVGEFQSAFGKAGTGNGELKGPEGMAIDAAGNFWVADTLNGRIQELSPTGAYIQQFGKSGSRQGELGSPRHVALDARGDVWVTALQRVEEFSATGEYLGRLGSQGTGNGQFETPSGIVADTNGHVWVTDRKDERVEEFTIPTPYLGKVGSGQFGPAEYAAFDSSGNLWVLDSAYGRLDEFSSTGEFLKKFGSEGGENGQLRHPGAFAFDSAGNIWVADSRNNRLEVFSAAGGWLKTVGSEGSTNGKFSNPMGIAIDSSGNIWVADTGNNRVQEFNSTGEFVKAFGKKGTGNGEFQSPEDITIDASGNIWVADTENNRLQEFNSKFEYQKAVGSVGTANGQLKGPRGMAFDASGNLWVADYGNLRVQEFVTNTLKTFKYGAQFDAAGSGNGQLDRATDLLVSAERLWVVDYDNSRIEELSFPSTTHTHATRTIYYTVGNNKEFASCGNHSEWVNLACRTEPVQQPATGTALPVVEDRSYNIWDEPTTIVEEVGTASRTKTLSYDNAGRMESSEETSTIDTAVPKVSNEYSSTTGALIKQSTSAASIKSVYDTLGDLTEYTDAGGNTTKYTYAGPTNDGRIEEIQFGGSKGSQTYSYDPTTKALTSLVDLGPGGGPGAGTFTAAYDVEGRTASETYPNGMTAKYTYNPAGETTGLEYEKTTHCTEKCVWFSETVAPSIHGEALLRSSSLSREEYSYDGQGRLLQVNETPTGKGCKTRLYSYNEDDARTSETSRESATETCATSGGTTEAHSYDEVDRLVDTGVESDGFGNETKIPAADAGGHELTASFYGDNQVAVQKQNGETTNYTYDPVGRTEQTVSEGTSKAAVVDHYAGPGGAISWSGEEGEASTRSIPGIDGSLAATQHNSEPAVLQIHDLQGNVVATAAVSETETKLLTTYNATEFGVPVNGTPPTKFSWLGSIGLTTEASSGAANPGGGSYVPQLGRALQTEAVVPPGAYANGSFNGAAYTTGVSAQSETLGTDLANGAPEREASRLAAARKFQEEEEERQRQKAELEAELNAPVPGEGGTEEWEGTIGDPVGCNVYAYAPYTEEQEWSGHKMYGSGGFFCQRALPSNVWFELCFFEGGTRKTGCQAWKVAGWTVTEQQITHQCKVGLWYTIAAWLWKVGESAEKKTSEYGLCEENFSEFVAGGEIHKILGG